MGILMSTDDNGNDLQLNRKQARKTAWILACVAIAIFAAFIGSTVLGR
jgi:hypothetical protein